MENIACKIDENYPKQIFADISHIKLDDIGITDKIRKHNIETLDNIINGIFNELGIELTEENYRRISNVGGDFFTSGYYVLDLGKKEQLFLFAVKPVINNIPEKLSYDMHFESKFNLSNYIKK